MKNTYTIFNNPSDALREAIRLAGGQSPLASKCGIRQQSVYVWLKTGRLPAERVLQVEKIVGGKVTRYDLRPDIYPRSG